MKYHAGHGYHESSGGARQSSEPTAYVDADLRHAISVRNAREYQGVSEPRVGLGSSESTAKERPIVLLCPDGPELALQFGHSAP